WKVCGRERVRAPGARDRALPLSAPRTRPAGSLPSTPRPALPPSPRNQCSCCLAGCGFLQSLPRLPLRPERARSPAQQCPPVPSCEPRPQPRTARGVASRPTRPASEEREEDGTPAPPPFIRGRAGREPPPGAEPPRARP
ncbi:hypothetical protein MC885_007233, partial [Smutsia gigantea]